TLLILRATELLTPDLGADAAATTAIGLYVGYNIAATVASIPAGRLADRRGPRLVFAGGIALFVLAYATFAAAGALIAVIAVAFIAAGVGIGAVETAEHAAVAGLAPEGLRGSAFGLLAGIQSLGDLAASAGVGLLWTLVSPAVAFSVAAVVMFASLVAVLAGSAAEGVRRDRSDA
ncbi:MAG: MFS transporter, partial [Chloroflexi bacterium]|nr:MFS transporter [Chloroflexota bacterium]